MSTSGSPSVALSAPYPLLPLSLSVSQSTAESPKCYGAQVQNQCGQSRKRKRSEYAVAVDGSGISLIDVQAPRTISTYSTPPATRFACPPISVKNSSGSTRWTYASTSSPSQSICLWQEKSVKRSSRTSSVTSSPTSEYSPLDTSVAQMTRNISSDRNVVALHNIPPNVANTVDGSGDDVLVVMDNYILQCLSSDLQTERWSFDPEGSRTTNGLGRIVLSKALKVKTALKTVLKTRPEVLAGYRANAGDTILILVTASSKNGNGSYSNFASIYLISNTSGLGNVRKLVQVSMISRTSLLDVPIHFQENTGIIFAQEGSVITNFHISELTAYASESTRISSPIKSILPLPSNNILISTDSAIILHNSRYSATHATLRLKVPDLEDGFSETRSSLILIDYLPDVDVAIVYNDQGISAVQITIFGSFTGSSLMDSLSKNVGSIDLSQDKDISGSVRFSLGGLDRYAARVTPSKTKFEGEQMKEERRIQTILKNLSICAIDADAFGFEKEFAEFVGLERNVGINTIQNGNGNGDMSAVTQHSNGNNNISLEFGLDTATNGSHDKEAHSVTFSGINNGHKEDDLPEFLYPQPDSATDYAEPSLRPLSQAFIASMLGMIFKPLSDAASSGLELVLPVPNIFKYLLMEGYFSCTHLPRRGDGFVEALARSDPELDLLLFFLDNASPSAIPLAEVVTSVKVVMTDLVGIGEITQVDLVQDVYDDLEVTEDAINDEQLQKVTQQAENALEQAQLLLDLSEVKERILRAALLRVGRFSKLAIIKTLREKLNGGELAGLIRILRRELLRDSDEKDTVEIVDGRRRPTDEIDNVQDEEWLGLICDLLTNAVDAAGMTGLLLAKDTLITVNAESQSGEIVSDEAEEFEREELLLESLSNEVSATCDTLEGASQVSEAIMLFLLRAEAHRQAGLLTQNFDGKAKKQRKTAIVERERKRGALLPMGYPPPIVQSSKNKNYKAEVRRNRRSHTYHQSMSVGAYTLERIEV